MNIRGRLSFKKLGEGYTILEVLIFLAVSALVFVGAVVAINGRQDQVQFTQSTREFETKMADLINDVSTGYFPAFSTIECTVDKNGSNDQIVIDLDEANNIGLGSSEECIYIGKAIQFAPRVGGDSNLSKMIVYNVVGKKYDDGRIVTSLENASPTAVAKTSGGGGPSQTINEGYPIEEYELRYNLEFTKIFNADDTNRDYTYNLVGLFSNLSGGSADSSNSSQVARIGAIRDDMGVNSDLDSNVNSTLNLINGIGATSGNRGEFIDTSNGIVICLEVQGGSNKKASLTIGGNSSATTNLQIDDYNEGCDD